MNEKIKEIIANSGMEWTIQSESDKQNIENFVKAIVHECISQNIRTAKTMRDNGLTDHCPPHMYNFEISQLFDMTIVKHSSTEE